MAERSAMIEGLPELVRVKADAQGLEGERWLRELPQLIDQIQAEWHLSMQAILQGGTSAVVADVTTDSGEHAILKIAIPDGLRGNASFAHELQALLLGDGRGYAVVLRHDLGRRAMLLEKLGPPMASFELGADAEMAAIAATLQEGWRRAEEPWPLPTGEWKATWLGGDIAQSLDELPASCDRRTAFTAMAFARARAEAFDASTAVLVHGDAHPHNVLLDPSRPSPPGFKLVDPEGLVSEPAHDLAIPLRAFDPEGRSGQSLRDRGLELCSVLSDSTGVDPRPIWEWAFVERVTSGLFLHRLGHTEQATQLLGVANELVGATP